MAADSPDTFLAQLGTDIEKNDLFGAGTGKFAPSTIRNGKNIDEPLFGYRVVFNVTDTSKSTEGLLSDIVPDTMAQTGALQRLQSAAR